MKYIIPPTSESKQKIHLKCSKQVFHKSLALGYAAKNNSLLSISYTLQNSADFCVLLVTKRTL